MRIWAHLDPSQRSTKHSMPRRTGSALRSIESIEDDEWEERSISEIAAQYALSRLRRASVEAGTTSWVGGHDGDELSQVVDDVVGSKRPHLGGTDAVGDQGH